MNASRYTITALLLLLPGPAATHLTPIPGPIPGVAQETDTLETDTLSVALFDRVRVWAPEAGLVGRVGTFHGWERGRFRFHTSRAQGARELTLPPGEIERVEVQRITGNRWWVGSAVGGGLGLAGGGAFTLACGDECDGLSTFTVVGVLGAGAGALSGALFGLMIPERSWVGVSVGPPLGSSASEASRANGVALLVRVKLPR